MRHRACPSGTLVLWSENGGVEIGLPDRMYGLADFPRDRFTEGLPEKTRLNLPPGVVSEHGIIQCETHLMRVEGSESAWQQVKRVGRQGVRKAERLGCVVAEVEDTSYLTLSHSKSKRMGSPAMPAELLPLLRCEFGSANVGSTGVLFNDEAIAAVVWVVADGYALLIDGASSQKHWDKNPNNLAVWTAIECVISRGADIIDFGFSPIGSGDAQFKKHMGGTAVPLFAVER